MLNFNAHTVFKNADKGERDQKKLNLGTFGHSVGMVPCFTAYLTNNLKALGKCSRNCCFPAITAVSNETFSPKTRPAIHSEEMLKQLLCLKNEHGSFFFLLAWLLVQTIKVVVFPEGCLIKPRIFCTKYLLGSYEEGE